MLAIFLDIETTGLDPKIHRVIDIGFKIIDFETGRIIDSYQNIVKQPIEEWKNHDPISLEINGYTFEAVQKGVSPEKVKEEIIELFTKYQIKRGHSLFICQNPAFDRVFFTQLVSIPIQEELKWPYHWLDLASMYWALQVKAFQAKGEALPSSIPLSKNKIAEVHGIPPEESPHLAINGVDHLIACYQAVLNVNPFFESSKD